MKVTFSLTDTFVKTSKGLVAIGAITAGSMELAYNEVTGQNEYQPILQIFENQDPEVTFLTVQDFGVSSVERH